MKNKKTIIIILILIVIIELTLFFIKKDKNKKTQTNSNNSINTEEQQTNQNTKTPNEYANSTTNNESEYDKEMKKLYEIETDGTQEETIITIIDKEEAEEPMKITDKDIKYIEILSSTKGEAKQKAIENKIYTKEAIKMGITLSQEKIEEIEKIANSDKFIGDETSKANYEKRIYTYLMEIDYKYELKNKIRYEIDNNKISIENENIKTKTQEYHNIKSKFTENKNPTEEEKGQYLSEISDKYFEIQNLYLEAIKDKYSIIQWNMEENNNEK